MFYFEKCRSITWTFEYINLGRFGGRPATPKASCAARGSISIITNVSRRPVLNRAYRRSLCISNRRGGRSIAPPFGVAPCLASHLNVHVGALRRLAFHRPWDSPRSFSGQIQRCFSCQSAVFSIFSPLRWSALVEVRIGIKSI